MGADAPDALAADWPARRDRRIVEIASGMNYWTGQAWAPSDPSFTLTPEGDVFIAERVQHRTRLAANLNVVGAVTVSMPEGTVLRSTPVAIGLFDATSGRSAILAGLRDCEAVQVSSGPLPISFYRDCDSDETNGKQWLRPGGGIAYTTAFTGIVLTDDDPDYVGYVEEEYARLNITIRDNWTIGKMGLKDAVQHAIEAFHPPTELLEPPWEKLPSGWHRMRMFGYENLHFNEFNRASDTWW